MKIKNSIIYSILLSGIIYFIVDTYVLKYDKNILIFLSFPFLVWNIILVFIKLFDVQNEKLFFYSGVITSLLIHLTLSLFGLIFYKSITKYIKFNIILIICSVLILYIITIISIKLVGGEKNDKN